jgi:hypothetical protein
MDGGGPGKAMGTGHGHARELDRSIIVVSAGRIGVVDERCVQYLEQWQRA